MATRNVWAPTAAGLLVAGMITKDSPSRRPLPLAGAPGEAVLCPTGLGLAGLVQPALALAMQPQAPRVWSC